MRPEHEGVDLAIRQCPVVLNTMDLRYRRQQVFDVARASALGSRPGGSRVSSPIQYPFDSGAQPGRRLRLGLPNRFVDLHDERRIDGLDRKIADYRIDVGLKRRRPFAHASGFSRWAAMYASAHSPNLIIFALAAWSRAFASRLAASGSSPSRRRLRRSSAASLASASDAVGAEPHVMRRSGPLIPE